MVAFRAFSLETAVPNLVYLTIAPVSRYRAKVKQGYFQFMDFSSIPYSKNCHNSRTTDNFDIKFEPATKLEKRITTTSKNWEWPHVSKLWCHLEQSRDWIPDARSVNTYIFSNSNLFLTKTENRTKKSLTQLSRHLFE